LLLRCVVVVGVSDVRFSYGVGVVGVCVNRAADVVTYIGVGGVGVVGGVCW